MTTKELQKKEAIHRMTSDLGLDESVVRNFRDGKLMCSERVPGPGGSVRCSLVRIEDGSTCDKVIKKAESDFGIMVYHVTHEQMAFGSCLTMLYVGSDEKEWELEAEDIYHEKGEEFFPMAYVANLSEPLFSEFGSVGMKEAGGGLIRTQ